MRKFLCRALGVSALAATTALANTEFQFSPQQMQTAREVFRSDLYRRALSTVTADIPGASEKVEGGIDSPQAVASQEGKLFLGPDQFFDGRIFDPYESA